MAKRKVERNQDIVMKKRAGWSFRDLAEHFNIDVRAVWEIYHRDKKIYKVKV